MEIVFDKEYLRELFYEGKAKNKKFCFQPQVIRKYVQVINVLDAVEKVEDLYRYRSLHYEKLVGNKKGLESVRVDSRYRIEFKTSSLPSNKVLTICNIVELSNHYK